MCRVIKRVVGVPGDVVELSSGAVTVNGTSLSEATAAARASADSYRLAPGMYFLLGDNPGRSADSRAFGPVPESMICGRAALSSGRVENIASSAMDN